MIRPASLAAALVLCLAPFEGWAQGEPPAPAEWQVAVAEDGQFEAMFPQMPRSYTDRWVRNGITATSRVLAAGTPPFYCIAGYTDYSADIERPNRTALEVARDNYINSTFATLLESRNVDLFRAPSTHLQAMRYIAIADTRRYTSIIAVEGRRFYHVVASSQRFGFSEGDVARCLSGFKLLPPS